MSKKQKLKQVVAGAALVACGVLSAVVTNDSTAAFVIVPMGLYSIFAREEVIM